MLNNDIDYRTIREKNEAEIIEKKSRFIGQVFYVESKKEAEEVINEVKKKHYSARHNCYAYNVYDEEIGDIYSKSSDDGEPSGTAGAPILAIINGNKLVNVLVVVTRYFGGILLGTGGLAKAYKDATEAVIKKSKLCRFINGYEVKISIDYKLWDNFNYYCKNNGINIIKTEYLEKIECIFEVPKEKFDINNDFYEEKDIVRQKVIFSDFGEV